MLKGSRILLEMNGTLPVVLSVGFSFRWSSSKGRIVRGRWALKNSQCLERLQVSCYACFAVTLAIILDSGFCVLKGLVELRRRGLYACALIKKRRYWPTHVLGNVINSEMQSAEVGETRAISGVLDGVSYNFWMMREPDYIMSMMATGGRLLADETCKQTKRSWLENGVQRVKEFVYALPFDWHFRYRHAVDDHNNLRHAVPSIEETWVTTRWECRVFAFILAVSEVNAYLIYRYFVHPTRSDGPSTLLEFRRKLAWQLINNPYLPKTDERDHNVFMLGQEQGHSLRRAPLGARRYRNRQWEVDTSVPYRQFRCSNKCGMCTRTYCSCSPGVWICTRCHVEALTAPRHLLRIPSAINN